LAGHLLSVLAEGPGLAHELQGLWDCRRRRKSKASAENFHLAEICGLTVRLFLTLASVAEKYFSF
jgi:hypothetical protein